MKKFSGNKIIIGSAIYIFCTMGFLGLYNAAYSLYPETYNISLSTLGIFSSVNTIAGVISSFTYATVAKKFTPKGCLYFGALALIVFGLISKFVINYVGLLSMFILYGLLSSFSTYTVLTEIVSNWYIGKRAQKISVVMSASMIGIAVFQFAGGILFTYFDLPSGMLIVSLILAAVLIIITKFMIIADNPAKIGEYAYQEKMVQISEGTTNTTNHAESEAKENLYHNPVFWLCILSRFLGCGSVVFITMYATVFFTRAGLSLAIAATILSIMSFASAFFTFISGKVLETFKIRKFVLFITAAAILSNLGMILYSRVPSVLLIIMIVICYGIGYSMVTLNNLISGILFDSRDASNANSKMFAMLMAGNIFMFPIAGMIVDKFGFDVLYILMVVLMVASASVLFLGITMAKRQGKSI